MQREQKSEHGKSVGLKKWIDMDGVGGHKRFKFKKGTAKVLKFRSKLHIFLRFEMNRNQRVGLGKRNFLLLFIDSTFNQIIARK